jgi:nucleoside-triphosphatase THEP1
MKGGRFIQKLKEREDVLLLHVTEKNRDELVKLPSFYEL